MTLSRDERRGLREKLREKNRRLKSLREQLKAKDQELTELRAKLAGSYIGAGSSSIEPENLVWIFCAGRSGSTWLASMISELPGNAMWNEPLVGALFGEFYEEKHGPQRGRNFILGKEHRGIWIDGIRSMVLQGAVARHPNVPGLLVIKEPHGSVGAPLLVEALPESRMVFLVRDPRDVVASRTDARREGGWTEKARARVGKKPAAATIARRPLEFVESMAREYSRSLSRAKEAYEIHRGRKVLVKYEELRADTMGVMRRICAELGINVAEEDLARTVDRHSWEKIPEEEKGEGKFYRKATPGGWRWDLSPEQVRVVERETASLLKEFYPAV